MLYVVRIIVSPVEGNLSPVDSNIACLYQSIKINKKHVWLHIYIYHNIYQSQQDHILNSYAECVILYKYVLINIYIYIYIYIARVSAGPILAAA